MLLEKYTDLLSHISERELVEITRNLVRFQSVNPPGNELPIAKYAAEFLSKEGLEVEILEHADNRGSLVAKLGGGNEPGLIYSGHLDVVKPEGEWHRDPFAAEVAEGKIWGRGTSDMKSGVASIIAAVSAMARTGLKLKGPLYLSLTAGEETGCLGAEETIKRYPFKPVQAVFIAEPSENEVITAEMGAFWLQIKTIGRAAHIMSKKDGRNAMLMMLPILEALEKLEIPFIKHPVLGEYSRSPNTIFAGRSINTIPAECIVKVDQRTVPGQDHEQILHKIREVIDTVGKTTAIADFKAEVSVILDKAPIEADFAEPVLQKLVAIRNEITGAKQTAPKGLGGFSDAVAFVPALDVPFAICGPGNPALTHQANEWVQISKIVDSAKIYSIAGAEYLCE